MSDILASKVLTHKRTFDLNLLRMLYEASGRSISMVYLVVQTPTAAAAEEGPMKGFVQPYIHLGFQKVVFLR